MNGPYGEYKGRPIYRTWDDAMSDPSWDLRVGFLVADPAAPPVDSSSEPFEWPPGWTEVGFVDETGSGG